MLVVIRSGRVEVDEDGRVRAVYGPGDTVDIPDATAAVMVESGAARAVEVPSTPDDVKPSRSAPAKRSSRKRTGTAAVDPGGESR